MGGVLTASPPKANLQLALCQFLQVKASFYKGFASVALRPHFGYRKMDHLHTYLVLGVGIITEPTRVDLEVFGWSLYG